MAEDITKTAPGPFGMGHDELRELQAAQASHARTQRLAELSRREPLVRELVEEIEALRKQVAALSKPEYETEAEAETPKRGKR